MFNSIESSNDSLLLRYQIKEQRVRSTIEPTNKPQVFLTNQIKPENILIKDPIKIQTYNKEYNNYMLRLKLNWDNPGKSRSTHMTYLTNNLKDINLNQNLGLKEGILMSYGKILSYNYNKSQSISNSIFETSNLLRNAPVSESVSVAASASHVNLANIQKGRKSIINKVLINNRDVLNINKILVSFFKGIHCIIGKPVFIHTTDKVIIQLFYYLTIPKKKIFRLFCLLYKNHFKSSLNQYRKLQQNTRPTSKFNTKRIKYKVRKKISRLRSNNLRMKLFKLRRYSLIYYCKEKLRLLCLLLSKQFNKSVEFQLIRLHNPNHDSNILVNLLSVNIRNKTKKARRAIQNIYKKKSVKIIKDFNLKSVNGIPNYISGLNIKIAGRLMKEPIIPRLTTKVIIKGASSPGKVNYLDIATITKKNRKGAYTITIKSGQNFFNTLVNTSAKFRAKKVF